MVSRCRGWFPTKQNPHYSELMTTFMTARANSLGTNPSGSSGGSLTSHHSLTADTGSPGFLTSRSLAKKKADTGNRGIVTSHPLTTKTPDTSSPSPCTVGDIQPVIPSPCSEVKMKEVPFMELLSVIRKPTTLGKLREFCYKNQFICYPYQLISTIVKNSHYFIFIFYSQCTRSKDD